MRVIIMIIDIILSLELTALAMYIAITEVARYYVRNNFIGVAKLEYYKQ